MGSSAGRAAPLWRGSVEITRDVLTHELPRLAAALTYYTVLSLLPALMVVILSLIHI